MIFSQVSNHSLPIEWNSLGLKLGKKGNSEGTSQGDFLAIIESEGAAQIQQRNIGNPYRVNYIFNGVQYVAAFWNKSVNKGKNNYQNGLFFIGIYKK